MNIEKASRVTEELYESLQRLIPQLGAHKALPGWDELDVLIRSDSSSLIVARDPDENGSIAGILCLAVYRVPTGVRSMIEDVVVDENMRGRGIGKALVDHALALAREAGADGAGLTSNPQRQAANKLYRSMGFELRKTNLYFYRLK